MVVVSFSSREPRAPKKQDVVYSCECGCRSFTIQDQGRARCELCHKYLDDVVPVLGSTTPVKATMAEEAAMFSVMSADTDAHDVVLNQTIKTIRSPDTALVLSIQKDGAYRLWTAGAISDAVAAAMIAPTVQHLVRHQRPDDDA